ncbi:MAG TPA: hypothetical protein VGQ91_03085, partial [Ideonella sp.]|nr:hypothetical protein [Ideonella sp.]
LDFASVVGFQFNEARVVRANDSLSLNAMALLHAYHCHLPEGHAMRLQANGRKRRLLRLLSFVQGPKFRLDRRIVLPILRRQEADTEWIAGRVDKPLPPYRPPNVGDGIRSVDDLPPVTPEALDWLGHLSGRSMATAAGPDIALALGDLANELGFEARLAATRRYFEAGA